MRTQTIRSRENPNLELIAFHGHFATRHSHNSYYLDITRLKHEYSLAHDTALALANHYIYEKSIDTIICMDMSGRERGHRRVPGPTADAENFVLCQQ